MVVGELADDLVGTAPGHRGAIDPVLLGYVFRPGEPEGQRAYPQFTGQLQRGLLRAGHVQGRMRRLLRLGNDVARMIARLSSKSLTLCGGAGSVYRYARGSA